MGFWTPKKPDDKGDFGALSVDEIVADPNQPRKHFDNEYLLNLGESIKRDGHLQPAMVRWSDFYGKWMLILGECRWRAARMAGLKTLLCVYNRKPLTDDDVLTIQLAENIHRNDLSPIETARSFLRLKNSKGFDNHQLSIYLKVSDSTVHRVLSLLELPEEIQEDVRKGELAAGVAHEIGKAGPAEEQKQLAAKAKREKLTRKQVKEEVRAKKTDGRRTDDGRDSADGHEMSVADTKCRPDGHQMSDGRTTDEPLNTYTFQARGADVLVGFPTPASLAQVVEALEEALRQARASLPAPRIAA